jgi:hypothetical protein
MRASANPAVTVLPGAARVALRHDIQDFPRTLRSFLAERKTGAMLWVLLAFAATGAAAADLTQLRSPAGGNRPVLERKAAMPSASPIGSVSPQVGPWHTFAHVSASGLAGAANIRVVWFPGDDDSQPQAGAITATMRGRTAPDQVEIEIPADAGGPQGGVVRILAFMPGRLQPLFVARFTVGAGTPPLTTGRLVFNGLRPRAITTAPLQMSGSPPRIIVTETLRVSGPRLKDITTPQLVMSGKH